MTGSLPPQRDLRSKAALLSAILLLLGLRAPSTAAQSPPTYRITGIVLSERNGAPVPGCHLLATETPRGSVTPRPPQRDRQRTQTVGPEGPSADTDSGGHFTLNLHSSGDWRVYASARGFRSQAFNHHEDFFSAVILTPDAPTYDLIFHLEPDSAISGLVLDEAGEAVRNARVSLLTARSLDPDAPTDLGSMLSNTVTDDRGHYEFPGLPSGNFNVGVQAEPWYAASSQTRHFETGKGPPIDPALDVVYPQTWFPGVFDRHSAEIINLRNGEDREADFSLTPAPATHLHISAPSPDLLGIRRGQNFPAVERVSPDGVSFVNASVQIDPAGQIDVGGLSPGLYRITLQRPEGQAAPAFIRVLPGEARSLDLASALPVASLTLHLQAEGDADRLQIVLTDVDTGARFSPGGGPGGMQRRRQSEAAPAPGADRKLDLPPARYRVTVVGDADLYLSGLSTQGASAKGGIANSIQGRSVALSPGPTTLTLRLTRGRATARGIVTSAGKPLPGAMVMLVPATYGQLGSITILRRDQTNTDGGYLIENIIPGDYILLAIDGGWTVNWHDPSTLARFLAHGTPLTLGSRADLRQELPAQTLDALESSGSNRDHRHPSHPKAHVPTDDLRCDTRVALPCTGSEREDQMPQLTYQSGFGNEFATEAQPGALPVGQNSPQRNALGLYTEQVSGSAFTAPRLVNRRTWMYRIRPSVVHEPYQPFTKQTLLRTGPFDELPTPPNQMRWNPPDFPSTPTDFVEGIVTLGGSGDPAHQDGFGIHIYTATTSMRDRFFYNADGEMLILPQLGGLRFRTECGILEVKPGEVVIIPRGIKFQVELLEAKARGYICENYGQTFRLPDLGPIGANGLANSRDFLTPVAAFEDRDGEFEVVSKFLGNLWLAKFNHSPLDVVAWHGNYAPSKYDLARFNCINTVSFDHPDPSIYTVLTAPSPLPGVPSVDFAIFPPRWLVAEHTFRPPWFHRNMMNEFMGLIHGEYDAKAEGFLPGGASLHNCMSGHGPDAETFDRASSADLKPQQIKDTLAFMFETRLVVRPTRYALEEKILQHEYYECWQGLKRLYPGDGSKQKE